MSCPHDAVTVRLPPQGTIILLLCAAIAGSAGGCGLLGLFQDDCGGLVAPPPDTPLPPIPLALHYLKETQLKVDQYTPRRIDYAGDWPQCFAVGGTDRFIRDASPFMATFIHHALTSIREEHQDLLELTDVDLNNARMMRTAAVDLMLRFQAGPQCPDAGTFGFWPQQQAEWLPGDLLLEAIGAIQGQGPQLMGVRAPINVSFYPDDFAIGSDADDTATIYAALLDHTSLDGGPAVDIRFEQFFADWRDLGQAPRRNGAPWLPTASGAYLTWLAYRDDTASPTPNCVDLVVNANVLYALGRYDRLDTPGVSDAVGIINAAVDSGAHLTEPEELSLYYPNNLCFHYCVTRAFGEGGVSGLGPAAELLVQDLQASAEVTQEGHSFWNRGDPQLSTAFGVMALLNAGCNDEIVDRAVRYLQSQQDPVTGAWEAGAFFRGRLDSGVEAVWVSPALTTAMALEALCAYELLAERRTTD